MNYEEDPWFSVFSNWVKLGKKARKNRAFWQLPKEPELSTLLTKPASKTDEKPVKEDPK